MIYAVHAATEDLQIGTLLGRIVCEPTESALKAAVAAMTRADHYKYSGSGDGDFESCLFLGISEESFPGLFFIAQDN